MTKARDLADLISTGNPLADGAIAVSEVTGAAPLASPTFTGNVSLGDNVKLKLGDSQDLELFHDGSHSIVKDSGTGNLKLLAQNFSVQDPNQTEQMILATPDGSVNLYYDGSKKIETTSVGADVTGGLTISGGTATQLQTSSSSVDGNIFSDVRNTNTGSSSAIVQRMITSNVAGNGTTSADFQKTKAGSLNINNNETNSAARIRFSIGGSERFRFGSSGQLGIGGATYGTSGQVLTSGGSGAAPTWADAGGGTHSFITKIEVTTRNSSTLTVGNSYITSTYNDYYWELIVPANGWASSDDYTDINITLQYNNGSYSNPYNGKMYFFKTNLSVSAEGSGQRIADGMKRYSSGTGGNQDQVYQFKGTLVSTQDLDVGARVMSDGTYFHNSNDYIRTLHTGSWIADGTNSYKITGLRMTASADFPVGTRFYLYGINRS